MTKHNYVVNEKKSKGPQKFSCKSCALFIFNPKTGAFMGRTASSWAKIILFYCAFYSVLTGLFAFLGWVFLQTLDKHFPRYMLDESLIGTSPGMGFRPLPLVMTQDNVLLSYNVSSGNYSAYTTSLSHYLEGEVVLLAQGIMGYNRGAYDVDPSSRLLNKISYMLPPYSSILSEYIADTKNSTFVPCNGTSSQSEDHVCTENVNSWFPCNKENDFGYKNGTPCVFIKLNKIIGWKPEYYDVENLTESMPQDLRSHIDEVKRSHPEQLNTIWVSCKGDRPQDRENVGPIKYIPRRGFWGYYFPYTNQPHYITPLMAIQLEKPARNVIITVECRAWAKNIKYDHQFVEGSVVFQIKVDS